jgi:guanosine-3',5'-bis(diphosphate) 3'-pyrophosphohydrolase
MTAATHPATVDLSALPAYVLALRERIAYLPEAQV